MSEKLRLTIAYEEPDDVGWIVARVIEVPGVTSQGRTPEEARENVIDALRVMLAPDDDDASAAPGRREQLDLTLSRAKLRACRPTAVPRLAKSAGPRPCDLPPARHVGALNQRSDRYARRATKPAAAKSASNVSASRIRSLRISAKLVASTNEYSRSSR